MPKPYNGFISDDDVKIGTETDVLIYEIDRDIRKHFPGLRGQIHLITDNLSWWATLLARVPLEMEKPPLAPAQNHPVASYVDDSVAARS